MAAPRGSWKKLRRITLRLLLGLAVLLILLPVSLAVALRSRPVRQALLELAAEALAEGTGIRATADDFRLGLLSGEVELSGLVLATDGSSDRPFLEISKARAEIRWRPLLSSAIVAPSLRVDEVHLDLGAPLPELPQSERSEGGSWSLDVARLVVDRGRVSSGPLSAAESEEPPPLEILLDAWELEELSVVGSIHGSDLAVSRLTSEFLVSSRRRPPIAGQLEVAGSLAGGSLLSLRSLRADAPGLRVEGAGAVDLAAEAPVAASRGIELDLAADLGQLFPDLTAAGELAARAALRRDGAEGLRASFGLRARGLPASLLEPWLEPAATSVGFDWAGSHLEADGRLEIGATARFEGTLQWHRGDETLLRAVVEGGPRGREWVATATAEALPARPGHRRLRGELRAPPREDGTGFDFARGEINDGRLEIEAEDLADVARRLGVEAATIEAWGLDGELAASVVASGPVSRPQVRARAGWRRGDETVFSIEGRTLDAPAAGAGGEFGIALDASLWPDRTGRRDMAGRLGIDDWREIGSWALRDARLDLDEPDLDLRQRELIEAWPKLRDALPPGLPAGRLTVRARASGRLARLRVEGGAGWQPPDGGRVDLTGWADWAPGSAASLPGFSIRALAEELALEGLTSALGEGLRPRGRVDGEIVLERSVRGLEGNARLTGHGIGVGEAVFLDSVTFYGSLSSEQLEVASFQALLGSAAGADLTGSRLVGDATADLDADGLVRAGAARFELAPPSGGDLEGAGLSRLSAELHLEGGTLVVDPLRLELRSGDAPATASARVPLGSLASAPDAEAATAARWPLARLDSGPIEVVTDGIELATLHQLARAFREPDAPATGASDPLLGIAGRLVARLAVDPLDLGATAGTIRVVRPALETPTRRMAALEDLVVELRPGRWTLEPVTWRLLELPATDDDLGELVTSAELTLSQAASIQSLLEDPLAAIAGVTFVTRGSADAELLNPFLAGGVASGPVELDFALTGPARAPVGRLRLDGPDVRVYFPRPYPTRIEAITIDLRAVDGELAVERAEAELNRGTIRIGGGLARGSGLVLSCRIDGVRYRLDYGLTVQLGGDLALERPPGGPGKLSGALVVDRGMLRRDLDLDRELLAVLFGPPDLTGAEAGPLDSLRLDLRLTTREGVTVANNLADLHLDWDLLRLRGTVANPVLQGRIDADPGGLVTAFGQTVRVDRGALTLSGDPTVEPRLDLEVTTSFDDPTLGRKERWATPAGWGDRGEWSTGTFGSGSGWEGWTESLATGLSQHYTERFLTRLSGGLVSTSVGFEPLPIFGETDGEARLTIDQRLSPYLSYLLSINVREGEARTDLVEISGLRSLPGLTAQLFSNDAGNPGATLAQTLHLGGREPESDAPRLRRLVFDDPGSLPPGRLQRYRLRRAAGFRRGDTIPAGAEFDVEMDVAEQLRREGYPGALVEVTRREVSESRVDLRLDVEAGPKVEVAFEGAELPRGIRRRIASLYQPERLAEAASLEEMREETTKALHAQGFLTAEVTVRPEPPDAARPGVRKLQVECRTGARVDPQPPLFLGVEEEVADALGASFAGRLARIELAIGTPGADAEIRRVLRRYGFPEASVSERSLDPESRRPTITIDSGPTATIGGVEILGVPPEELDRLRGLVPLEVGAPVRGDRITRAVALLEEDFRSRGHADARVEVALEPDSGDPRRATVRLGVRPGPSYRLSAVDFEGLRSTDPSWAEDVAAIKEGAQISDEHLAEARRRLYGTRVFRGVRSRREPLEEPAVGAETVGTRAVFEVEEIARYAVSFGGRWESEEGLGGVVYAADRNLFGKGRTLGIQAIHAGEERRSLGLYHAWPRFLRPDLLLELFVEGSRELQGEQDVSRLDSWAQLTFPLGERTRSRVYLDHEDRKFGPLPGAGSPGGAEVAPGRLADTFLGWQLIHDTRRRQLATASDRLLFLGLDVSGSNEALGSDSSAIRLFGQAKAFLPFGRERPESPRPIWAQSLRIGWIETTAGELAPVDRLKAGGEYSVRGYPTESLGPLDEEGRPLGGEVFLILNEELQIPIWRELLGVVFFDAGNVWTSRREVDWSLATSAGVGLRSPSPIGPLRLDFAFPLDRREGIDPQYKVYFGFGPTF